MRKARYCSSAIQVRWKLIATYMQTFTVYKDQKNNMTHLCQIKNCISNLKYLSTFHAEYVALLQYTRDLVPMKTLVSEFVKAVWNYTKRLEFSTYLTVSEDNYGGVKVTQKNNLPLMTPGFKHIRIKYHLFIEKIYSWECYVKKLNRNDQKTNIFTRSLQGEIFLHKRIFLCGW